MQDQCMSQLADRETENTSTEQLTDILGIKFDTQAPLNRRFDFLLKSMGNLYCFRAGDIIVKLSFTENAPSLQSHLREYFCRHKSG